MTNKNNSYLPTLPGAKYRDHQPSADSILGASTSDWRKVLSQGSAFFNADRWTLLQFTNQMTTWAKKNPSKTPTVSDIRQWAKSANSFGMSLGHNKEGKDTSRKPYIQVAHTPDELSVRTFMAIVGGVYHECWHTKYSRRRSIDYSEVSPIVAKHWGKVKNWSNYARMLGAMSNIIEDVRIESLGIVEYPGTFTKMHDLQDFILDQESAARTKNSQDAGNTFGIVSCMIRDLGFQYITTKGQEAFKSYRKLNPKAVALVEKGGPLFPYIEQIRALGKDDDLACLDLAMAIVCQMEEEAEKDPEDSDGSGEGEMECSSCGAPTDKLTIRPLKDSDGKIVKGKGVVHCATCGHEEEIDLSDSPSQESSGSGPSPQMEGFDEEDSEDEEDSDSDEDGDDSGEGSEGDDEDKEGNDNSSGEEDGKDSGGGGSKEGDESDDGSEEGSAGNSGEGSDSDNDGKGSDDSGESDSSGDSDEGSNGPKDQNGESNSKEDGSEESDSSDGEEGEPKDSKGGYGKKSGPTPGESEKVDYTKEEGLNKKNSGAGGKASGNETHSGSNFAQTIKDLLEAANSGKDGAMGWADAASKVVADQIQKEDLDTTYGERPYRPTTTDNDKIAFVPPSDMGKAYDEDQARKLLDSVKSETCFLRTRLRNMIRASEMRGTLHGVRRGSRLSTKRLIKTRVQMLSGRNPKRPYQKKDQKIDTSIAVAIVLDESGSMHKIRTQVSQAMISIVEPLDALGAAIQVVGFRQKFTQGHNYYSTGARSPGAHRGAGEAIYHDVFMAFGERFANVRHRFANMRANGGTPMADGLALAQASLNERTEGHRIMFVITDGEAQLGHNPVMKWQIRKASEAGIHVVGIGIGTEAKYVKQVFPQHVYVDNVKKLPMELMYLLNGLLDFNGLGRSAKLRGSKSQVEG